jgi:hypothetical protein
MLRILIFCSLIISASSYAQDAHLGYHLDVGKRYSLNISIQQNTFSEDFDQGNNISLDLKMTIHFDIISQLNSDVYYAMVKYDNLFFSMLAPTLKIDINSESGNNTLLPVMIDSLETKSFKIQLGKDGSVVMFGNINEFFYNMYDFDISSEEEQDVIIKTLREAFGNNAFTSICNLFVNFHPSIDSERNWEKKYTYFFNTKPVNMESQFFLIKQTEVQNTVQGIGMISTDEQVLETINSTSVLSSAAGSHTFDLQVDPKTGWLKIGSSRQRIMITTTIVKDAQLPEGLEIPSYTETTFGLEGVIEQ